MSSDGEIMFSGFGQVWKTLLEFREDRGIIKLKLGKTIENKWNDCDAMERRTEMEN